MYKRYWIALLMLAILSPLGLLAEGTAWGEWGSEKMKNTMGYIPEGMERLGNWWQAIFPDYSMHFLGEGTLGQAAGYIFSALLGSALIYIVSMLLTKSIVRQKNKGAYSGK